MSLYPLSQWRFLFPVALFLAAFALLSFGYSMALWGVGATRPWAPEADLRLFTHIAGHAVFGMVVALPSRRADLVLLAAAMAVLLDVDHTGLLFGWPVPARASHSLGFLLVAPVAIGLLAARTRMGAPATLVAAVTLAAILAHVAWDGLSTAAGIPLLLPFETDLLQLSIGQSLGLTAAAVIAVGVAERLPPDHRPLPGPLQG